MPLLRPPTIGLAIVLLLGLAPANVAGAQRPLAFGVAGGVSIPEGRYRDAATTGWHALGTLALSSPMQPLGLRADAAYNRFASSDAARALTGDDPELTVSSATLNASYRLPMPNSPLSPYVITGLGAYRTACSSGPSCAASTRFGWNAGVGTKLYIRGVTSFLEARYHRTTLPGGGIHFFPVTLGLLL